MEPNQRTSKITVGAPPGDFIGEFAGLSSQQAEELNRLGTLQQTYKPDPVSRRKNARLLWAGIAVGLIGLLPLIVLLATGDVQKNGKGAVAGVLLATLFLPLCGWRLRQLAHGRHVRILVFADGFARIDRHGFFRTRSRLIHKPDAQAKVDPSLARQACVADPSLARQACVSNHAALNVATCRWEEIESVQGMMKTYRAEIGPIGTRFITIVFGAGRVMRIDGAKEHLAGSNELYQRVCAESGRHFLPRMRAAIEAGQTVAFGILAISKRGLHWGKHLLAWDDAENVDFGEGEGVRIRNPTTWPLHPWVRLVDFAVPNYPLFLSLAEHYFRESRQAS